MSELSEYREALAEVLSPHYLTTPVQCACGWRETDGHGVTYARHQVDALLASPVLARIVADATAGERERVAQAIEAGAKRRHDEFAADEDETLRLINERFPDRLTPLTPDHHNRHDDGCHMCGIANAARIAREPDTDRPDTAGERRGDADDVETGRCCPSCRVMLTDHNRAVWGAGYAVGQRHAKSEGAQNRPYAPICAPSAPSGDSPGRGRGGGDAVSEIAAPWPLVNECHSRHVEGHSCAQCDGSHDHAWLAWHDAPEVAPGITDPGPLYAAPGIPVRCRVCGGRKCDTPECRLSRHHYGPHEEF